MKVLRFVLLMSIGSDGLLFPQQEGSSSQKGRFERVKAHGKSLEGNLEGDSPDRDVSIYLPLGYDNQRQPRYPVVYLLHGYGGSDQSWYGPNTKSAFQSARPVGRVSGLMRFRTTLPAVADKIISSGGAREMILVSPTRSRFFRGACIQTPSQRATGRHLSRRTWLRTWTATIALFPSAPAAVWPDNRWEATELCASP